MKYILSFLLLVISFISQAKDTTFIIQGSFSNLKSGKMELIYTRSDKSNRDSAIISNGTFSFKGSVTEPVQAYLVNAANRNDYLLFYLEPGTITISGGGDSLKLIAVTGSEINMHDKKLREQLRTVTEWEERNAKIYDEAMKAKNKHLTDSLDEVDLEVLNAKRVVVTAFVKNNPNSFRSALAIKDNYSYYAEASDMEPAYNYLSEEIKESKTGISLKKMLETYRTVAIGKMAPEIIQLTPEGNNLALSSIRGKYVLVDFWASWCGPCRRENPNVVSIYNEYKHRDFTVFGVSYDAKKDKWEKAIKDDGLAWAQVSDLQGWKNSTSEQYGIKAIPSNMILDKNGVIIAKNLFGKKLNLKMQEIMSKP